jgi:hypothetical protein
MEHDGFDDEAQEEHDVGDLVEEDEDADEDENDEHDLELVTDLQILYLPPDRESSSCRLVSLPSLQISTDTPGLWSPQDRRGAGQDHPQGPRGSPACTSGPQMAAPVSWSSEFASALLYVAPFLYRCAPVFADFVLLS